VARDDFLARDVVAFQAGVLSARLDDFHVGEADAVRIRPEKDVARPHAGHGDLFQPEVFEAFAGQLPDEGPFWHLILELLVAIESRRHVGNAPGSGRREARGILHFLERAAFKSRRHGRRRRGSATFAWRGLPLRTRGGPSTRRSRASRRCRKRPGRRDRGLSKAGRGPGCRRRKTRAPDRAGRPHRRRRSAAESLNGPHERQQDAGDPERRERSAVESQRPRALFSRLAASSEEPSAGAVVVRVDGGRFPEEDPCQAPLRATLG
jgi:hypothetical protein